MKKLEGEENLSKEITTEMRKDGYTGKGTWTSDDDKYVGEYKDGKSHGQGTYTKIDGFMYTGEWKEGKKDGQATCIFASGSKYVGEFKKDMFHGQGTYIYANGDRIKEGLFENDKFLGEQNLISFLTGATPDSEEEVADLFNEFKTLAENVIIDPIKWENDSYFEDDYVSIRISGIMMSENDKFRLTLDNDGSPCLDIYGVISPSTKLTASFSAYDERYKVEDQLNNVLKDIQNKETGVYHKYYRPGDFG